MRLAATNLSLPFNADESALMMLLASELRVKQEDIQSLRSTRHSLDARDKADIRSIYSVSFELSTENAKRVALLGLKNVGKLPERSEREPEQVLFRRMRPLLLSDSALPVFLQRMNLPNAVTRSLLSNEGNPLRSAKRMLKHSFPKGC